MLTPKKALPKVYKPHVYQEKAVEWLIDRTEPANCGGAALFLDPGLGKTSTTLLAFKKLKDTGKVKTMLVVAPLRVAQATWPNEIDKWLNFMDLKYVVVHGKNKLENLNSNADIYIINYEGIKWLTEQKWKGCDVLCFDELTRMKSWKSGRVKAIKAFLPTFKRRFGLTGTPIPNGFEDIFSQVYMLDLGARFGKAITKFKVTYFNPPTVYSRKLTLVAGAEEAILDKLSNLAFRIDAKDWLDLPEEIFNTIELELPKDLRAAYEELKAECITELESLDVVTAVNASALSTKLRQFLSGNVYVDGEVVPVHTHKVDALKELIEDNNGSPILVGYMYKHELAEFKKAFKQAVFIESGTAAPVLQQIIADWNAGNIPVLFGHPQAIGHGLNLQDGPCNTIVFVSLDFNLENYLQFIKRIARQGQKQKHVIIHSIIFKDTIDEYIQTVLTGKDDVQTALLNFLRQ